MLIVGQSIIDYENPTDVIVSVFHKDKSYVNVEGITKLEVITEG